MTLRLRAVGGKRNSSGIEEKLTNWHMCKRFNRKLAVGIVAIAGILASASDGHAALMAVASIDGGAFTTLGSALGPSPEFFFSSLISGIRLQGGASSDEPGTTSGASLFDASIRISNTSAVTHSLRMVFTDDAFTAPVGSVSVISHASGVSSFGGVSLNSFTSYVNATAINHPGLPLALSSTVSYSNDQTLLMSIPSAPYVVSQDFTFTMQGNTSLNFSNDLAVSPFNVTPVPEPATVLYGTLLVLVATGHGISRRRGTRIPA